jgi:hypothetical protein
VQLGLSLPIIKLHKNKYKVINNLTEQITGPPPSGVVTGPPPSGVVTGPPPSGVVTGPPADGVVTGPPSPSPSSPKKTTTGKQCTSYTVCTTGTLKKCCKDEGASRTNPNKEGVIYKLQKVIGTTQDGYFGIRTENALFKQLGKKEISVEEAKKEIELASSFINVTTVAKTADEQKKILQDYINDGNIEDGILIGITGNTVPYKALDGVSNYMWAYAKKYNAKRDSSGKLLSVGAVKPMKTKNEITYEDNTLVVIFFYDLLWGYLEKGNKLEYSNKGLSWKPGNSSFKFSLDEQVVDFSKIIGGGGSSSDMFGSLSQGSGSENEIKKSEYGTSDNKSGSGGSSSDDDEEDATKQKFNSLTFCESMSNRQDKLRCMFGFINDDGETFSPKVKIETMNVDPTLGIAGEGSIQFAISQYDARSNYFDDYNELLELEGLTGDLLKYPDDYPMTNYAGQTIDLENSSGLIPLEGDAATQYSEFTFGKFLGTNSTLKLFLMQSGRQAVRNIPAACADKPERVRENFKIYLTSAFLGTRQTKNVYENLYYLNRCIATNVINDDNFTPFTREDFPNVSSDKLPFNMIRKELKLADIKRLLRGGTINGIQLKAQFSDENFATENAVYESLNTKVKRHITEAIKTKEKVKIKNRIITEILLEMKR